MAGVSSDFPSAGVRVHSHKEVAVQLVRATHWSVALQRLKIIRWYSGRVRRLDTTIHYPSEDPINWYSETCQLVVPITTVSDGNGEDDVRTSAASAPSLTTTTSAVTVSGSFLVSSSSTADVESEVCSVVNLVSAETYSVVMAAFNMGGVPIAERSFRFL